MLGEFDSVESSGSLGRLRAGVAAALGVVFLLVGVALIGYSSTTAPCSNSAIFWKHVYNPTRLTIEEACVSITGTVVDATGGKRKDGVRHESDGDCHGWLKLDGGEEKYLNAGNVSDEGGNLVFEIQCLFPVTQADAKSACANWHSPLKVPPVGSHVQMTGSWVQDDHHAKWFELHPVMSVEVIE